MKRSPHHFWTGLDAGGRGRVEREHFWQPLLLEEAVELLGVQGSQHVATHAPRVLEHKGEIPTEIQIRANKPEKEEEERDTID